MSVLFEPCVLRSNTNEWQRNFMQKYIMGFRWSRTKDPLFHFRGRSGFETRCRQSLRNDRLNLQHWPLMSILETRCSLLVFKYSINVIYLQLCLSITYFVGFYRQYENWCKILGISVKLTPLNYLYSPSSTQILLQRRMLWQHAF